MASSISNPKYENFRKLLIEYRLKQGATQTQLAERLGRPQSFVSKYENGERRLDLIEFLDIAATLEIDPFDFIKELLAEKKS
jgi:transcriptional regulator with XRE-family HTH domain